MYLLKPWCTIIFNLTGLKGNYEVKLPIAIIGKLMRNTAL